MARLGLGFVLVQAAIGVASNSTVVYLAQPVLLNAAFGLDVRRFRAHRPPAGGRVRARDLSIPR